MERKSDVMCHSHCLCSDAAFLSPFLCLQQLIFSDPYLSCFVPTSAAPHSLKTPELD